MTTRPLAFLILAMAVLHAAPGSAAPATPRRSLLALSKTNHTLAIVDPVSLKVIARLPVGPDPHEVIASADGATAYVSNTGSGRMHELDLIDLMAQKALPSFDTGPLLGPHGLVFTGGKLWFTAEGAKSVARYDPATAKVDWILGTGQNRTHMIDVSEDGKQVTTTNVDSSTLSILENVLLQPTVTPMGTLPPGAKPRMEWIETVVPVGKGSEGFDVSPDGRELWTAAAQDGTVSVVDLANKKVVATIDAKAFGANRLKFTPDGKRVLISSLRIGELFIYEVASRKEVKRLSIGHGGAGLLVDSDGTRAFVACSPDDVVVVVDLNKLEVAGHIDVGGKPDGLAWAVRP